MILYDYFSSFSIRDSTTRSIYIAEENRDEYRGLLDSSTLLRRLYSEGILLQRQAR
jgi:hypothetical protein